MKKIIISLFSIYLLIIETLLACSYTQDNLAPNTNIQTTTEIHYNLIPYSVDELIRQSDSIVIGTVVNILPAKENTIDIDEDQIERGIGIPFSVYTDIIIQPKRYLIDTSDINELIAIRVWGGSTGDKVLINKDEANFNIGEDVLVFLYHPESPQLTPVPPDIKSSSYYFVLGLVQGKYQYAEGIATNYTTGDSISIDTLVDKIASIRQ